MLFRQIVAPKGDQVTAISDLWQSLDLQGGNPPQVVHTNANKHPTLQQDLDASTLTALEAHMAKNVGSDRLARLLTAQKPRLAGYSGPGDQASISSWIEANW